VWGAMIACVFVVLSRIKTGRPTGGGMMKGGDVQVVILKVLLVLTVTSTIMG
jgi:hypothetical protein